MSIDYDLEIYDRTQPLDHLTVRAALVAAFSLQTEDDHFFHDPDANLVVTVIPWLREDSPGAQKERAERKALGFRHPGVNIGFGLEGNYDEVTRLMYRIVNWVLEHYPAVDAQLSFNDPGNFYLFRSRGRLVLVDKDEWRSEPALQTLMTLPYEYRKASVYFELTLQRANPNLNPMALANLLLAHFNLSIHPYDAPRRITEGLILAPYRFDNERPHDFSVLHDHGQNLGIHLEIDVLSYDTGLAKLVAITRWVLEQYAGDATLEWHPQWDAKEPPLLTRTAGHITLSDEPDFWTPERKAIILGKP